MSRAGDSLMDAEVALDCRNDLGESVLWDPARGEVLWVNIHRAEIWRLRLASGELRTHNLSERVGAIALRERGGLVVGIESGFALFDTDTARLRRIEDIEPHLASTRLNDGRCDRQGRFICGGMNEAAHGGAISSVYRLDPDLTVHRIIEGISCANSTCFSLDGTTMYFTDMPTGRILAYDYDPAQGEVAVARTFTDGAGQPGLPDGSTVDAEGFLWNARWGGGCVIRYAPDGAIDRIVRLPVTNPTCVAFGGDDHGTLFITTARFGLSPEQLAREPFAGSLFAVRPGVCGVPEPRFQG